MIPLIVLINAPPRAGKDTLADDLVAAVPGTVKRRMAHELKVRTHRLYDCPPEARDNPDYYETMKETALPDFRGLTPRAAYIAVSETYFKPTHGDAVFGHMLADWIGRAAFEAQGAIPAIVVPDSGFLGETQVLIDRFGAERVLLLRVHAEHRGCSFAGDSRSYIYPAGVECWDLQNQVAGDTNAFLAQGERAVAAKLADLGIAPLTLKEDQRQVRYEALRAAWNAGRASA